MRTGALVVIVLLLAALWWWHRSQERESPLMRVFWGGIDGVRKVVGWVI